jgi:signal transduction histidine kinase
MTVNQQAEIEQYGDYEEAPPEAAALFESLRAYGYSTESAIADLIDNSIAARATQIDIRFDWRGKDSWAYVFDNGSGMTETELSSAMRPGSQHPSEVRRDDDLGRFGLGMKTASVSQCKNLSVVSKKDGTSSDPNDAPVGRRT